MKKAVLSISKKDLAYERWLNKFIKAPSSKELDARGKRIFKNKTSKQPLLSTISRSII